MVVPFNRLASYHGSDGFGEANLPVPVIRIEKENAALGIIRLAKMYPGNVHVYVIGVSENENAEVFGFSCR